LILAGPGTWYSIRLSPGAIGSRVTVLGLLNFRQEANKKPKTNTEIPIRNFKLFISPS